jgi:hypothetical protein
MTENPRSQFAELVLRNAAIWTADRAKPWAEAVAVREGRVAAAGSDVEVKAVTGPQTRVMDLGGKMVMPGINDVHVHAVLGGRADLHECNFLPVLSLEKVLEAVEAYAAKVAEGEWIVGGIWGSNLLSKLASVDARRALDKVSGSHPVVLYDDTHHNRWVSSRALAAAGITANTPDPNGGEILRAENGEPVGILLEAASIVVDTVAFNAQKNRAERDLAAARRAVEILNGLGVTGFQEAGASLSILAAYKSLDDCGGLSAWVVASLPLNGTIFAGDVIGDELIAQREKFRGPHIKPDYAKIFLDGVPPFRTAAFLDPYLPDETHGSHFRGTPFYSLPELVCLMAKLENLGLPVKIHATGDASLREVLDAVEILRYFHGADGLQHHIAHASFIHPADIGRFKALNVVADLSPSLWYPGPILAATKLVLGEERALRFWPNRDLHQTGALLAAGSDWPVMPSPTPWDGIESMLTRRDPSGNFPGELWPEQALDLETVLQIYTVNAARAMGIDQVTGTLTVGKSADMIVLDRNLFTVAPDDIADTKVLMTLFEGRIAHDGGLLSGSETAQTVGHVAVSPSAKG